ncbi:sulfonate ABC transporter ATP-binding protein [Paenibacillus sp. BIHB 4019]|uniref:Sulfonate ABC transporter ATP-binding protein n=1 Tax=Paenibacillus sp. BIHB 4019 TaxID=1870819 RepID=A0A1B2DT20_9BACL|nr:sulfonate ABC transporter ATP-binding protein [Paenibacillus sp. BIHB 4019]
MTIRSLHKSFNRGAETLNVLSEIDFSVKPGQFVSFIGPSGCGKSTLLKIVAGLDGQYAGSVMLSGKEVTRPSKEKGVIFQEHRLFPWLTVEQNIAADLSLRAPEVRKQVDDIIALVKLQGFEKSYPRELSGGMSQRVAIARALLRNPEVLLLDEPFGALDAFTKTHMQEALLDIWEKNGTTMLLVTHDIDEAVFLSNRIYVMGARPGTIKSTITIDLPYPRDRTGISFQQFRTKVLSALNDTAPVLAGWEI